MKVHFYANLLNVLAVPFDSINKNKTKTTRKKQINAESLKFSCRENKSLQIPNLHLSCLFEIEMHEKSFSPFASLIHF